MKNDQSICGMAKLIYPSPSFALHIKLMSLSCYILSHNPWLPITHTHMYIYTYIHMYMYIYIYIHAHIYMYVCMYIYIYTHTHAHTHTHTHTQIYIYIYIHTYIHIHTHTHRTAFLLAATGTAGLQAVTGIFLPLAAARLALGQPFPWPVHCAPKVRSEGRWRFGLGDTPPKYGLIWYSTSILGSWISHWNMVCMMDLRSVYDGWFWYVYLWTMDL